MAIITTVRVFHEDTAYNASSEELAGAMHNGESYEAAFIWFEPSSGYNGNAVVQMSPDGGDTWFTTSFRPIDNLGVYESQVAFDGSDTPVAVVIVMPEVFEIRVQMSGGSAGTLTAKSRFTDGRY